MADHGELLALGLTAGLPLAAATVMAERVASGSARGVPPVALADIPLIKGAFALSYELGAPAAMAARVAAEVARSRDNAQAHARSIRAGPVASMWLLTILPIAGPMGVALLGADVGAVYFARPVARWSLLVGALLTVGGWRWSIAVVRRAARPARYPAPHGVMDAPDPAAWSR